MEEICEVVFSQRNCGKLNAQGYLMVKDKRRGDEFYWRCEKKDLFCNGRAVTRLSSGHHVLVSFVEHNHSPSASRVSVLKAMEALKTQARDTANAPCQIIQACTTSAAAEIAPCLPSANALRCMIRRVRKCHQYVQPRTLAEVHVPEELQRTLDGDLAKDAVVSEDRILLFTTRTNVDALPHAAVWIMDGTFKTAPMAFYQTYTIHAPVGSRIFPLVYALMSGKSQALYKRLFEDLVDVAEEYELRLNPQVIMTDLELAAINAAKSEFQGVVNKVCFFHTAQCIWRKIQSSGLASHYSADERFSLKLRHLSALAFLPAGEIPAAFDELKLHMPEQASEVTEWFESTYVHGRIRRRSRAGAARSPPLFPPSMWPVYESMHEGYPRTQNSVEAWHRRWETVVGKAHMSVYRLVEEF
ncbi:hypothetical protein M513_12315 [Trichuris suis]|uniref:MULE transposase domain-containing protein n=1 Tax=Trichuris suis TaxID=68888 RepID=A0A085LP91_9BILA|nr:hypothetical protein M513_12315 [Trichuris suis]